MIITCPRCSTRYVIDPAVLVRTAGRSAVQLRSSLDPAAAVCFRRGGPAVPANRSAGRRRGARASAGAAAGIVPRRRLRTAAGGQAGTRPRPKPATAGAPAPSPRDAALAKPAEPAKPAKAAQPAKAAAPTNACRTNRSLRNPATSGGTNAEGVPARSSLHPRRPSRIQGGRTGTHPRRPQGGQVRRPTRAGGTARRNRASPSWPVSARWWR